MSKYYAIVIEGMPDVEDFETMGEDVQKNIRDAINSTVDRARAVIDREIRQQINFKKGYLATRLTVAKRASGASLEGVITGRDRPTSLARFIVGTPKRGKGVNVAVQPGSSQTMGRAWLMNLKNGNRGLAIRLAPGEKFKNKKYARKVASNIYLLYGPSVNQAMRLIAEDKTDEFADYLEIEYTRLQELRA